MPAVCHNYGSDRKRKTLHRHVTDDL
jgi:hypothetical protein